MPKLIILGTSNAVPDVDHETTHLAVIGKSQTLLIDCAGNPTVQLRQAGIDPLELTDLLLTHFHPDHVAGVPLLLMNSWLIGRKEPLRIFGLQDTLGRVQQNMELYEWSNWPNFFQVSFNSLPAEAMTPAIKAQDFRIFTSPVCHMIPTIGMRIESLTTGKVIAYSCDTEPCDEVIQLAQNAEILVHEATGAGFGHSSASQAGEIARKAGVNALYLIHYQSGDTSAEDLINEASQNFAGPVRLTYDFMEIDF